MGKIGPAAILVAVIIGIWVLLPAPEPTRAEREAQERSEIQALCQAAVSRRLVSPGSMRVTSRGKPELRNGVWSHTLTVDSQNRMGTLLRSRWACRVRDGLEESVTQLE